MTEFDIPDNFDAGVADVQLYSILDEAVDGYYSQLGGDNTELITLAGNTAEQCSEQTVEAFSGTYPELGVHRDLIRKGYLGLIMLTAQRDEIMGEYQIPSATTFAETLFVLLKYYDGDIAKAAHEWSLLAMMASVISNGDGFLFSQPDARLAHITMGVVSNGLSRGLLGLDGDVGS